MRGRNRFAAILARLRLKEMLWMVLYRRLPLCCCAMTSTGNEESTFLPGCASFNSLFTSLFIELKNFMGMRRRGKEAATQPPPPTPLLHLLGYMWAQGWWWWRRRPRVTVDFTFSDKAQHNIHHLNMQKWNEKKSPRGCISITGVYYSNFLDLRAEVEVVLLRSSYTHYPFGAKQKQTIAIVVLM